LHLDEGDSRRGRGRRGEVAGGAPLRAEEKSQRWEEELTGGPHLSANERKKKRGKGRVGPLDARWAARLKLGCRLACGLGRREGGPARPELGRGEGREGWRFWVLFFFKTLFKTLKFKLFSKFKHFKLFFKNFQNNLKNF
jgi:hypothetical protein